MKILEASFVLSSYSVFPEIKTMMSAKVYSVNLQRKCSYFVYFEGWASRKFAVRLIFATAGVVG